MDLALLTMCAIAFAAVFVLLTVLSVVMAVLTAIFPGRDAPPPALPAAVDATDATLLAAITTTMNQLYPGASVTKIEEIE